MQFGNVREQGKILIQPFAEAEARVEHDAFP